MYIYRCMLPNQQYKFAAFLLSRPLSLSTRTCTHSVTQCKRLSACNRVLKSAETPYSESDRHTIPSSYQEIHSGYLELDIVESKDDTSVEVTRSIVSKVKRPIAEFGTVRKSDALKPR